MDRVLLITMPFGPLTRPAIGISLLKAQLQSRGIPCDIRYLSHFFAELVGAETYQDISESAPTSSLIGDWLFRKELFGVDSIQDDDYLNNFLPSHFQGAIDSARLLLYQDLRDLVDLFLDACMSGILWERYRVVGFTTTFQQTVASLALASRIKRAHPHVEIAFGGANCEGPMGQELARQFPFLDYVFSGESDRTFPALVEALMSPSSQRVPLLPGITTQSDDTSMMNQADIIDDLDGLPFPDYSDFVFALQEHGFYGKVPVQYLIETSRGCWWGQKHHCTFCGLNGGGMRYRSKRPERVIAELVHLHGTYGAKVVWGTDNILDTRYFRTVLPALKKLGLKMNLFFETKANLTKDQLKLMRDVGITWFQPGIESLCTHVLSLMRKGCTGLQNIQLLKWVRQLGMVVTWNVLVGFPGETAEDYLQMAKYCEAITHLQPPSGAHPIRLDRFSPYFSAPEQFGLTGVRPYPSYSYIYPFTEESLRRLAYFFVSDYKDGHDPLTCASPTLQAVGKWFDPKSLSMLCAVPSESMLLIYDTRLCATDCQFILTGAERAAYLFCDSVRSFQSILDHVLLVCPEASWTSPEARKFLDEMIEKRLMLEENDHYLSLAVLVDADTYMGPVPDPRQRKVNSKPPETPTGTAMAI